MTHHTRTLAQRKQAIWEAYRAACDTMKVEVAQESRYQASVAADPRRNPKLSNLPAPVASDTVSYGNFEGQQYFPRGPFMTPEILAMAEQLMLNHRTPGDYIVVCESEPGLLHISKRGDF